MRRIRRRYPDQEIWIALDQDRAHPRKCSEARRTMRELKLRWISLPKGSPDDNPVETVFSDIKASILECSNDPDAETTQRCISTHLRNRNRRTDRHIQISYLPDTHKE
jgi:transposase